MGRLHCVDHAASVVTRGFDAADNFEITAGSRTRIGRGAEVEISVTRKDGRAVLGGHTSYIIEHTEPAGWIIKHTGHIGSMAVDGVLFERGDAPLTDGARIELFNCDTREVSVAMDFKVEPSAA